MSLKSILREIKLSFVKNDMVYFFEISNLWIHSFTTNVT